MKRPDIRIHDCVYYAICVQYFDDGSWSVIDPPRHIRAAHQLQMLSMYKIAYEEPEFKFNRTRDLHLPTMSNTTTAETRKSDDWMNHFWCFKKRKHFSVNDLWKLSFPQDVCTS